jgi:hypothetical protein
MARFPTRKEKGMAQARRSWVRGTVVLGVAATMMAGALLTPALGTKSATTQYVKQKVRKVRKVTVTALRRPDYQQSLHTIASNSTATVEGSCGGKLVVSGGLSHGGSQVFSLLESYPSDGNLGTLNVSGRSGWTVTAHNALNAPQNVYLYLICATAKGATGNVAGPARATASSQEPGWRLTLLGPAP